MHPVRLAFLRDTSPATDYTAGSRGPSVSVKASAVQGMCAEDMNGKVQQAKFETELSLTLNKTKLSVEVLVTDFSQKRTANIPNDTATHRARNAYGLYKNMPGGENYRFDVSLNKIVEVCKPVSVHPDDPVEVKLRLKVGPACFESFHNPTRLYGPFGERGGGFVPCPQPFDNFAWLAVGFATRTERDAFEISLTNAWRAALVPPKKGGASEGAATSALANPLLPLEGKSIVFTGDAPHRDALEARVATLGGKVTSAVSGKTSYLMAYVTSTTKYKKAVELRDGHKPGPRIFASEAELLAVLDEAAAIQAVAAAKVGSSDGSSAGAENVENAPKRQKV